MNFSRFFVAACAVVLVCSHNATYSQTTGTPVYPNRDICIMAFYSQKAVESSTQAKNRVDFAYEGVTMAMKPSQEGGLGFDVKYSGMLNVDDPIYRKHLRGLLYHPPSVGRSPDEDKKAKELADAQAEIRAKSFQAQFDLGYVVYFVRDVSDQKLWKSDAWLVYNQGNVVQQIIFLRDATLEHPDVRARIARVAKVAEKKPVITALTSPVDSDGNTGGPRAPDQKH